jgi:hypothetical protein
MKCIGVNVRICRQLICKIGFGSVLISVITVPLLCAVLYSLDLLNCNVVCPLFCGL